MNIYQALARVMADVGAVGKTKKNTSQGYQFRGVDDVVAHVQEVMAKHGVVVVPRVVERERDSWETAKGGRMFSVRLLVEHSFFATDGSSVTCVTLGEAMDSGDKASNKAMSAALKYALTETLLIPTYEVDRDTEESSPEVTRPAPAAPAAPQGDGLKERVHASAIWIPRVNAAKSLGELQLVMGEFARQVSDAQTRAAMRPICERRKAELGAPKPSPGKPAQSQEVPR